MGGHTGATTTEAGAARVGGCPGSGHARGEGDAPATAGGIVTDVSTQMAEPLATYAAAQNGRSAPTQTQTASETA